jgi:hypothetical protein
MTQVFYLKGREAMADVGSIEYIYAIESIGLDPLIGLMDLIH